MITTRMLTGCTLLAAAGLLAFGCASAAANVDWKGKPIAEVIRAYGNPNSVVPGKDTTMYVWESRQEIPNPPNIDPSTGRTTPGGTAGVRLTTRTFIVNRDGIVTSWNRTDH